MRNLIFITLINIFPTCLNLSLAQSNNKTTDLITEKREVDAFDKIIMSGGNISVKYSSSPTLELTGSKSCIEMITTKVLGKSLIVKFSGNHHDLDNCKVNINIGIPLLNGVEQHGGGDIYLTGGFNDQEEFHCAIDGGGRIDVSNLKVKSFNASINGGGAITLNASHSLAGKISGGGSIEYSGNPKVTSDVSGGGRITPK